MTHERRSNQTSPNCSVSQRKSKAGGISPTEIIAGQSCLGESGLSATEIIEGQSPSRKHGLSATEIIKGNNDSNPQTDKSIKKKNAS